MVWICRVLVAALVVCGGLLCSTTSYGATYYGRPHRFVEDDVPPAAQPSPMSEPDVPLPPEPAQTLFSSINQAREAQGVSPLVLDGRASQCSFEHSVRMAQEGHLSHDDFPADLCAQHIMGSENIGQAYGSPYDAVLLLQRLMVEEGPCPNEPCTDEDFEAHGHYVNLLNPLYTRIGIGIYYAPDGVTWLTEDFTG